jgi:SAM-dependent methyltransferase
VDDINWVYNRPYMPQPQPHFAFGKNWANFLAHLNDDRIRGACDQMQAAIGDLQGKSFLDVGCGSGIHSLAALRLGAHKIVSFDFDPESVRCTQELKLRYGVDCNWRIEQGSALDEAYLRSLGQFDVVYSWGVLHHTGDMWRALDLITLPACDKLMVSIYNDQGFLSSIWRNLKSAYVRHPVTRPAVLLAALVYIWGPKLLLQPQRVVRDWRGYYRKRGMSAWHDVIDWAGGYPYEFATPEAVFSFFYERGFHLARLKTCRGRLCCNEFIFTRNSVPAAVLAEAQPPVAAATKV